MNTRLLLLHDIPCESLHFVICFYSTNHYKINFLDLACVSWFLLELSVGGICLRSWLSGITTLTFRSRSIPWLLQNRPFNWSFIDEWPIRFCWRWIGGGDTRWFLFLRRSAAILWRKMGSNVYSFGSFSIQSHPLDEALFCVSTASTLLLYKVSPIFWCQQLRIHYLWY